MSEFISVSTKSSITATTTITLSDGSSKSIEIHEGDNIDIVYMERGELISISGLVKVIKYSIKSVSTLSSSCIHEAVSDFSNRVIPTHLIVDCSENHHSSVVCVPVSSIRDFTPLEVDDDPSGDDTPSDDTPSTDNPSDDTPSTDNPSDDNNQSSEGGQDGNTSDSSNDTTTGDSGNTGDQSQSQGNTTEGTTDQDSGESSSIGGETNQSPETTTE